MVLKQCPSVSALFQDIVLKQCPLVSAAQAALTEGGEIFFYFNRTLFQDFKVNTNNIFQSRSCYFDPS